MSVGRRKRINLSTIRGMNMSAIAHQADEVNELINLRPTPNGLEGRNGAKTIMNTISAATDYRVRYIKGNGSAKAISNQGLLEYDGSSKWNYIGEIANLISKDTTNALNTLFFDTDYPDVFIKTVINQEESEVVVLEPCVYLVWNSSKKDDDQSLALWSYNMKLKSIMNAGLCIKPTSLTTGTYPGVDKYCIDKFYCLTHDTYLEYYSYQNIISIISWSAGVNGYDSYVDTNLPFNKINRVGTTSPADSAAIVLNASPPSTKVFSYDAGVHSCYISNSSPNMNLVHKNNTNWRTQAIPNTLASKLQSFQIVGWHQIDGGNGRVTSSGTTVTLTVESSWNLHLSPGDTITVGAESRTITAINSATELVVNSTLTVGTPTAYSIMQGYKYVYIYLTTTGIINIWFYDVTGNYWFDFDLNESLGTIYDITVCVVSDGINPSSAETGSIYKIFYIRDISGTPTLCHRTITLTKWFQVETATLSAEVTLTTTGLTLTSSFKLVSPRWILYNSATSYLINNYLIIHDGESFYRWAYKYTPSTYACVEDKTTLEFTKNTFPLVSGELLDIYIPPTLFYKQKLNQHLPVPIRPYFNYTTDTETWNGVLGTATSVSWSTPTLTGVGTKFLTEVSVGDYIRLGTDLIAKVLSITSDTILTLDSATASTQINYYIYRTIDLFNIPVLPNYQIPLNLNTGYPTKFNPTTRGTIKNLRWKYWLFYMLPTITVDGAPEATRLLRGYYNNSGEYIVASWSAEKAGDLYIDKKFDANVFNTDNLLQYVVQIGGNIILKPTMAVSGTTPVEFALVYLTGAPAILTTIVNITDALDSLNKKAVQVTITSASADCGFYCKTPFYITEGTTYTVKFRAIRDAGTTLSSKVEVYENNNQINKIMTETISIAQTTGEYEYEFTAKKTFTQGRSNGVVFAIKTNATATPYTVQVWDISITEKETFNAVVPWRSYDDEKIYLTDYIAGKTYNAAIDYRNNAAYMTVGGLFYHDRGSAWVFPDKPICGKFNDYGLWLVTKQETYLIQGTNPQGLSRNIVAKQGLDEEDRFGLSAYGKIAVLFNDSSVYVFLNGDVIDIGKNIEPYINKHLVPKYAAIDERDNSIWINVNIAAVRTITNLDAGVAIYDITKNSWRMFGYDAYKSPTVGYIGGVNYTGSSTPTFNQATGNGHYISFIMYSKLFKTVIGGLRYDDVSYSVEVINFEVDDDYFRDTMTYNNEYWDNIRYVLLTHEMSLDNPGVMKKIRRLEMDNFTLRSTLSQYNILSITVYANFQPYATTDTQLYNIPITNYNTLYPNSLSFNTGLQINGYSFTFDFIIGRIGLDPTTLQNIKLVMKDLLLDIIDIDRTRRGGF